MALKVLIVMGSDSDLDHVLPAATVLKELQIPVEVTVASAHRSPDRVLEIARGARGRGFGVVIAAAGGAAHLAGVFAANTTLPVVALPVAWGTLGGMDALLSSVQMPGGVPIASVGIGGGKNAGFFAAAILSAGDAALTARLEAHRQREAAKVAEADGRVKAKLAAG
ncbi:MAG TPA: 5-(carboxyamino)imidazole ribonucleotide mutase [Polyangiaceae bacterium]|jgi:5-(carboxyamino)imidazole ribonucleotide mutase|nr:5-(carboxyamino)imidazole ribonucleotide mutase [Polyangiaceae bacterium]